MASKTFIQASIREFARDPSIRKKAQKSNRPIMLINKRDDEFFLLFPPKLHDRLYQLYEDLRDAELVSKAMLEDGDGISLESLKKELL